MLKKKLTKKQLEVMKIFWAAQNPLSASEIAELYPSLNLNTVRSAISFLLKNEYIKTEDVILNKRALTRTYSAVISADEYVAENFSDSSHGIFSKAIFSNFVKQENDPKIIAELKNILEMREEELKEKK